MGVLSSSKPRLDAMPLEIVRHICIYLTVPDMAALSMMSRTLCYQVRDPLYRIAASIPDGKFHDEGTTFVFMWALWFDRIDIFRHLLHHSSRIFDTNVELAPFRPHSMCHSVLWPGHKKMQDAFERFDGWIGWRGLFHDITRSPLDLAAQFNRVAVMQELIRHGANTSQASLDSALARSMIGNADKHSTTGYGIPEVVNDSPLAAAKLLLALGADFNAVLCTEDPRERLPSTPWVQAALCFNHQGLQLFQDSPAASHMVSYPGVMATVVYKMNQDLYWTHSCNAVEDALRTLKILARLGAEPHLGPSGRGTTPLVEAVSGAVSFECPRWRNEYYLARKWEEVIGVLLSAGADPNYVAPGQSESAMLRALQVGNGDYSYHPNPQFQDSNVLKFLLQRGGDANGRAVRPPAEFPGPLMRDPIRNAAMDHTLLHFSMHPRISAQKTRTLLDHGADPVAVARGPGDDAPPETPLDMLISYYRSEDNDCKVFGWTRNDSKKAIFLLQRGGLAVARAATPETMSAMLALSLICSCWRRRYASVWKTFAWLTGLIWDIRKAEELVYHGEFARMIARTNHWPYDEWFWFPTYPPSLEQVRQHAAQIAEKREERAARKACRTAMLDDELDLEHAARLWTQP
jgi:hypothetical protein